MSYEGPWRNRTHQLYEQFCYPEEAPKKLMLLLDKYGCCFDHEWYYKLAGRSKIVVVRRPLWITATLGGWAVEKGHKREDIFQKKLKEFDLNKIT